MSIKNFKNPWVDEWKKGGKFDPDWMGEKGALENNAINLQEDTTDSANSSNDEYDSIDVIISKSSIQGVQQMDFIKTHKASKNPERLYVRYLDVDGEVLWTGDNFKPGTLEYNLFNSIRTFYVPLGNIIVLEGNSARKSPVVTKTLWEAWGRYKMIGKVITEANATEPNGRPRKEAESLSFEPNTLFFFSAYFANHSIIKLTNLGEFNQIISDIDSTFADNGLMKINARGNAGFSSRTVGFVVVGYHSPEPTRGVGLNNSQLAIGRAATIQKLLIQKMPFINENNCTIFSGGDSQEKGKRPAVVYFGADKFIKMLEIKYTPPTIGE